MIKEIKGDVRNEWIISTASSLTRFTATHPSGRLYRWNKCFSHLKTDYSSAPGVIHLGYTGTVPLVFVFYRFYEKGEGPKRAKKAGGWFISTDRVVWCNEGCISIEEANPKKSTAGRFADLPLPSEIAARAAKIRADNEAKGLFRNDLLSICGFEGPGIREVNTSYRRESIGRGI